ncbi:MAG TPA: TetR/AcrR family transcriptional regulator [Myxococcota bacterium]|nr:TetR/AcrR family transcriptional regulator [Myxococcota bacterium]
MGTLPMLSTSAPPTRRARKKERTRQEIFGAAMELFQKRGFESVTLDAICAAADVGRGTFFLHFPAKSALLWEWNRQVADEFRAGLREPRKSAIVEIRALVDYIGDKLLAQADVMTELLREFFATPPAAGDSPGQGRDLHALFEELVRRGQKRGELRRNVDPRLCVAVVMSTAAAILSGNVWEPGQVTPEKARAQFFEVVFHGLTGDRK